MKRILLSDYKARKTIADNLERLTDKKYIDISDEEYTRLQSAINDYTDSIEDNETSYLNPPQIGESITEKIIQLKKDLAVSFVDLYDRMGILETTTASYVNNYLNNVKDISTIRELVRSDWNVEDPSSYAYIINKPTIPTIPVETKLSYAVNGSGNAFTNISVNNHKITLNKGSYFLTSETLGDNLKTINNQSIVGTGNVTLSGLPEVTSSYNGKILMVVNGQWAMISPSTFYSGSGVPNDINGNNGDIYIQTNE